MSAYSEWVSGCISDTEYNQACREEDRRDRAAIEREMYIDACMDRCRECEMYDDGICGAGEIATRCTIV